MPFKLKRACRYPGCGQLTRERFCDEHQRVANRALSARRGTSTERGYDGDWHKLRGWYIAEHPLCEDCLEDGVLQAKGIEVDHIIPIHLRPDLRLDQTNLRSRCQYHHKKKTAEDRRRYGLAATTVSHTPLGQ